MTFNFMSLIIACVATVYFMLPAYVANLSGLAFGGGNPIDDGKNFSDNRRIIGNGVTWKGCINGTILGTFVGLGLGILGTFVGDLSQLSMGIIDIHVYGNVFNGLILGFLMAFGALFGDAVGSFLKRRMGLESGQPAPFLDQLDFVVGALIFSLGVTQISLNFFIVIIILSIIFHLGANSFAYLFGIKDVWY